MKTLDELVKHIKTHKDAVIVVGPGINPYKPSYSIDEFNEHYNRKLLRRDPEKLWNFYLENVITDINNSVVYDYIEEIDRSLVVDQNINGSIAATYLHGHVNLYKCQKCKTLYPIEGLETEEGIITECENCGNHLRPTVLLSGERYNQVQFDEFKEKLLETHTLILIGIDYTEEAILNLIADYGDMKANCNANSDENNQRVIVAIQNKEEEFNPNEIARCEFLVKDDITNAMSRFMDAYNSVCV